jgi:hypothetical protein
MKRILFLLLWISPVLGSQAWAIEIYADGHQYNSFQAYQASKKSTKASTPQVNRSGLSDATLHRFYVLSIENGMVGALQDFYQNWGQSYLQMPRRISSDQLQKAIQEAVTTSKDPKLLISTPGKVRIMAMSPENSNK